MGQILLIVAAVLGLIAVVRDPRHELAWGFLLTVLYLLLPILHRF